MGNAQNLPALCNCRSAANSRRPIHHSEFRNAEPDSSALRERPVADVERTLHELQIHQIELEMQNTELQEARNRLKSQSEKSTDPYDFAPISYFSLDEKGVVQEVNLTGAALLGVERSRLKLFSAFWR